jgi:hypothetical protein
MRLALLHEGGESNLVVFRWKGCSCLTCVDFSELPLTASANPSSANTSTSKSCRFDDWPGDPTVRGFKPSQANHNYPEAAPDDVIVSPFTGPAEDPPAFFAAPYGSVRWCANRKWICASPDSSIDPAPLLSNDVGSSPTLNSAPNNLSAALRRFPQNAI